MFSRGTYASSGMVASISWPLPVLFNKYEASGILPSMRRVKKKKLSNFIFLALFFRKLGEIKIKNQAAAFEKCEIFSS